jgi:hypothetical protein
VRRSLVTLLSLALAVAGSQVGHAAVYRIVAPDAREREELLTASGHGYLEHLPLVVALVSVLLAVTLVSEHLGARAGAAPLRPRAWLFAAVTPAVFVCQEHVERLLHHGSFPWGAGLERTFLLGLVLQAPFALAAYLVARLLLRVARIVGLRLAPPRRTPRGGVGRRQPVEHLLPAGAIAGLSRRPRGPPLSSL